MNPPEFLHQLAERFAPMSQNSSADLALKSSEEYARWRKDAEKRKDALEANAILQKSFDNPATSEAERETLLNSMQEVPPETLKIKFTMLAEQWWFRYLLAALFVWVQPQIQRYINPVNTPDFSEEHDEYENR